MQPQLHGPLHRRRSSWIAAVFVGIVAADVFISVLLRYFFSIHDPRQLRLRPAAARHPDLLGHRRHLAIAARTSPSIWSGPTSAPRWQRAIDVFATLVLLFVVAVQTYTLFDKVVSTYADNLQTFDLRLPTWPFFALAWIGDVAAVLLIAVRT